MTKQDRIKAAEKFIVEDNYLKAFDEFCNLHYDFPKDIEILQTCMFLLHRIIEGNLDFEPETAQQYVFRGISKFYNSELQASIADYDKAISMNSELDYAIKCKAFSLTHMEQYQKAIECLMTAVKLKPTGEYFDDIAENYAHLEDSENAIVYHEKAIQHSPDDPRLWYNYGTHIAKYGQIEKAIKLFDEAIRLYPQYDDALYNRQHYINKLRNK